MKKAKIIKGKKPRANDDFPAFADELTLAELIQNAAARGLHSVRGGLFARPSVNNDADCVSDGVEYQYTHMDVDGIDEDASTDAAVPRINAPPKGTTCACALGAQLLSPAVSTPLTFIASRGNDKNDGERLGYKDEAKVISYGDLRSLQIGVAYEQALRPEA